VNVIAFENKPREQIYRLQESCDEINDEGMYVLSGIVSLLPGKYPRYPLPPSVSSNGLRNEVVNVLRTAELVSDDGLVQMLNTALWVMDLNSGMYLRRPKKNAVILKLHQP
jgi:hypothetical protein